MTLVITARGNEPDVAAIGQIITDDAELMSAHFARKPRDAGLRGAPGRSTPRCPARRRLYVLVKEDGRWWVAARQNTLVSK